MIEYWGSDKCEACKKTLEYIQTTPFEYQFVDVTADFEGLIPRLVLEDGTHIIGPQAVRQYVDNWLQQMGFKRW